MQKLSYLLAIAELKRVKAALWVGLYTNSIDVPENIYACDYLVNIMQWGKVPNPQGIKNERVYHA